MSDDRRKRYSRIPAGRYAGQYRGAIPRGSWGRGYVRNGLKEIVCGACEARYRAAKHECPNCSGFAR